MGLPFISKYSLPSIEDTVEGRGLAICGKSGLKNLTPYFHADYSDFFREQI